MLATPGNRDAREIEDLVKLYTLIWNRFVACQMIPAVFDQTAIDIEAGRVPLRATGQVIKVPGFLEVYAETVEDAAVRGREHRQPARREGGRAPASDRGQARAALHPAAAAVQRGDAGQGAGGKGHRPPVHLRRHPVDHPGARLRREEGGPPLPDRAGGDGERPAGEELPGDRQHRLHRPDGGTSGRGGGGAPGVGAPAAGLLRAVREGPGEGQDRDARREAGRDPHRAQLREVRQDHGHQVGPQRPLPGLLRLPRVPQHQGIHPRRRRHASPWWPPPARPTRSARPAARP